MKGLLFLSLKILYSSLSTPGMWLRKYADKIWNVCVSVVSEPKENSGDIIESLDFPEYDSGLCIGMAHVEEIFLHFYKLVID